MDESTSKDYEDRIISEEVRRKMDEAVAKAEAEGIEVESEYYTGSDLDKMKEFAKLNDIGVITGPFADFGSGVNVPRTPTLFNLFAMEEELSHNRQPEDPELKKGSMPRFKAGPSKRLLNLKGLYDEEVRAKDEALEKTGGLLPKAKRTAALTRRSYAEMFKNGINKYVEETGDTETIKELFKQYPELRNVEEIKYPEEGLPFKQGGVVPMNNMAKQMEMFDDGGLMDEGGTVDPVSGNDVPPGSNQEEVRDDIPAQLSEGEFVFPADVVRFIGLEKLMMIRQRAKAGLQRMDDMGQMGNSEEAVMPDDLPFSIEDLDMEDDELEMAQGGVVHMANGGPVSQIGPPSLAYTGPPGIFGTNPNPNPQGLPTTPTTGVAAAPMKAASSNIARSIPIAQAATPLQAGSGKPTMFTDYELPQAPVPIMPQRDDLPAFLGEVTPGISGVDYVNEVYENEAGETKTFRRYTDDRLLDENGAVAVIPEGYKIKSEAEKDVGTGPVKVETATVQDEGDGGDNDNDPDGLGTSGGRVSLGGSYVTSGRFAGNRTGTTQFGVSYDIPGQKFGGVGQFAKNYSDLLAGTLPDTTVVSLQRYGLTTNLTYKDFLSLKNDPMNQKSQNIIGGFETANAAGRGALTTNELGAMVDKNGQVVPPEAVYVAAQVIVESKLKADPSWMGKFGKTSADKFNALNETEKAVIAQFDRVGTSSDKRAMTGDDEVDAKSGAATQQAADDFVQSQQDTNDGFENEMSGNTGYESSDVDSASSSVDSDTGNISDDSYDGGLGFGP